MKKLFILLFFFFNINASLSDEKVAYIDLNKIVNESLVGKSLNKQIVDIENKINDKFKLIHGELKSKEEAILLKKNIISDEEFNIEVNNLKKKIDKFNDDRNTFNTNFNNAKMKYSQKILDILNPILTLYISDNSISLLFDKNKLVVAKKSLDITDQIIKLLNDEISTIEFNYEKL